MTDQTLELLLKRLDHLTVEFNELRDGVLKAVRISNDDPEMALTRARKVLEYVVRDVFALRCQEDPGTRPLENLLQRLNKDGHLPKRLVAYASYIRDLGNVGTHVYGEELSKDDVRRSFENLTAILEWYFERVRPDAFLTVEVPSLVEQDAHPRLEEETLRREGQLAQELVREQEKVRRLQEEETRRRSEETERKRVEAEEWKRAEAEESARAKMQEPAQTTSGGLSESVDRRLQGQEGKAQLIAPPSLAPAASKTKAIGIVLLIVAVVLFLLGGGIKAMVVFFSGLVLLGIHVVRGLSRKAVHAAGTAPLPSPAHNPSQSPAELGIAIPGAFSGTKGKMIISAILGLVAGAIAAPILYFPLDVVVVRSALLGGVVHGLVTGFILIPISKALPQRVHTSLVGIVIGIIVGLSIRTIILSIYLAGRSDWYSVRDGQVLEIIGGGILGLVLGAIHGSKS